MEFRKIVGNNVLRCRIQKGLTQKQLAEKADIDLSYLRKIEHGQANLSANVIDLLKEALEVSMEELILEH